MDGRTKEVWLRNIVLLVIFSPVLIIYLFAAEPAFSRSFAIYLGLFFACALPLLTTDQDQTMALMPPLSIVIYAWIFSLIVSFMVESSGSDHLGNRGLFWALVAAVINLALVGVELAIRLSLEKIGEREDRHLKQEDRWLTGQIQEDFQNLKDRLDAIDKEIKGR